MEEAIIPVIEIFILFLFFYFILLSMRGTRGAGMLKGLVFVFILIFVLAIMTTKVLKLEIIHYILQNWLPQIFVILLIIIFQPELRNALLKVGQSRLFNPFIHTKKSKVLEEIINSVTKLARRKVGALIALERETGLASYIEGGVRLDAEVTSELLQTIFHPKTPLHDGAVIIKEERIIAAGCLFPLSDNPDISKTVGTRHRAAIGLTEESDAIAIVVSEETGTISVGLKGQLTSDLNKESLQNLLEGLYIKSSGKETHNHLKQKTEKEIKNTVKAGSQSQTESTPPKV